MDDDFKQQYEIQIKSMLEIYSCLCLMKNDLIDYAENEYSATDKERRKIIRYIENLDDNDMQNIADDFSNDAVMYSFWHFIEYQLDLIKEKIDQYG